MGVERGGSWIVLGLVASGAADSEDRLGREHANLNDFMLLLRRLCASGNDDGEADEKRLALTKVLRPVPPAARDWRALPKGEGRPRSLCASELGSQFDAWIHCDVTSALVPL